MIEHADSSNPVRVIVWGENRHERLQPKVAEIYPDGMHGAIVKAVKRTSPEQELSHPALATGRAGCC